MNPHHDKDLEELMRELSGIFWFTVKAFIAAAVLTAISFLVWRI